MIATMRAFDPRRFAWVDNSKKTELAPYLRGRPHGPTETVKVTYPSPDRAELEASLESPGLVILADVYYPGWELTIDGKPAPIHAVNRLMRGAAVTAGKHRLSLLLCTPIVPDRPSCFDDRVGWFGSPGDRVRSLPGRSSGGNSGRRRFANPVALH